MKEKNIIVTENLKKIYQMGKVKVNALNGVSISVREGEFVAIVGASGSGKSTLLHLLGLLDEATEGRIIIDGEDVAYLSETQKSHYRLAKLGYVFQDYALLPELTALENVILPLLQQGVPKSVAEKEGVEMLRKVGLEDRSRHYPSELSGGQMQRVSVARALVNKPRILFADEPTANLDSKSGSEILRLFMKLNEELKQTIVMVSHEPEHQKLVQRVIELRGGSHRGPAHDPWPSFDNRCQAKSRGTAATVGGVLHPSQPARFTPPRFRPTDRTLPSAGRSRADKRCGY